MVVNFNMWVGEKIEPAVDAETLVITDFYAEFQEYHRNAMIPLSLFAFTTRSNEMLVRASTYFDSVWTLEDAYTVRCTQMRNEHVETAGGKKNFEPVWYQEIYVEKHENGFAWNHAEEVLVQYKGTKRKVAGAKPSKPSKLDPKVQKGHVYRVSHKPSRSAVG